jgi:hypothetical protein
MTEAVTQALAPIEALLAADGYLMTVVDAPDGGFGIKIAATEDACEECLVPKPLMRAMLEDTLRKAGVELLERELPLTYPLDG